jgi:HD-GYP domain-containing protein (c-di-GMP phosphodiesterase class II)
MAEGNVIGMITATDKKNGNEFNSREEKLISAIASVAAIAIKNAQLYSEIKGLFEGFVDATVTAVESRDPTTAGHSKRVAALTVELAKKVSESDLPAFKGITFSREQLLELRYAGLLHDIGKVGVREFVLLKASKLPYGGIEEVRYRFDYIRLLKSFEILEKKHEVLLREGKEAYFKTIPGIDSMLALDLEELDRYQKLIEFSNNPQVLSKDLPEIDGLSEVAEKSYHGSDGKLHPYLTPFEFGYLNVLKGSLSPDERRETEMHVTHSFHFLSRIPWTANFPKIAEIVYTHHERMDGSGYPRGLKQDEIPLQARMIAVADTFDALTAWDRPYKKSVSAEKALFILEMESSEGRLDSQLVQLFRDEKVYKMIAGITSFKRNGSEV